MTQSQTVTVRILDKDYHISCPASESTNLERAAEYLDKKMRDIRRSGKVIGAERIAVMAALNITHELHSRKHDELFSSQDTEQVQQLLTRVQKSLDSAE
ncbi:cell division protein ZapA [Denitrificimonas caeni]|uniref:cell division protein ZapA n=1 Tax=Denitrificimonas caeni TaxID=521720 RepID=UPI001962A1DB|nr:cell division protein ZapA [Denitrificimonas caeni]